ncbi:P-loop containing nucleoside triphosphate hydrolase protein [Bimuria novae-zelandiae CBS 107.79]|uniref:P-loop containing nucleoside triphosphate hydrolase protein n=1 Tax=Bimuria novae-zelandiae CBS 107.79 TaxID=1447943 RepID=A0A6A5W3D1_9PLEO|nr:P-loop containing nucleoside triphosphate hydrolase protein [Bimuria novae-zelandiae CBS 107.79]
MPSLDANVNRVLELLVPKFHAHKQQSSHPIVLGITGLQGSGKSTWASKIVELLSSQYNLHAITVSLDDFYHTHDNLIARRDRDPENKLYRTRGQPGTHDQQLAHDILQALRSWDDTRTNEVAIPAFDKSQFNGKGDRAPRTAWPTCTSKPDVIVFEGWCLGFHALSSATLASKHAAAKVAPPDAHPDSILTLPDHELAHLQEVNDALAQYNASFMGPEHFDFFVHLDTEDLRNVYRWRLQQEHALWKAKGVGMSDESVRAFVRGYMPAYELYLEGLREGLFGEGSGRHVRVLMDRERGAEKVELI